MAALEKIIPSSLLACIARDKLRINSQVVSLRQRYTGLSDEEVSSFFIEFLSQLTNSLEKVYSAQTEIILSKLLPTAIELLAKKYLGPESRMCLVSNVWLELLPLSKTIKDDPGSTISILTNSAISVATIAKEIGYKWFEIMKSVIHLCTDIDILTNAALVSAWKAGVAHAREPACNSMPKLSSEILHVIIGLDNKYVINENQWRTNRWWWKDSACHLKNIGELGAFTGFGGQFCAPPTVSLGKEGNIIVSDGERYWKLFADVFGSTLLQIPQCKQLQTKNNSSFFIDSRNKIHHKNSPNPLDWTSPFNSQASDGEILALTSPFSFHVYIFAFAPEGPQ